MHLYRMQKYISAKGERVFYFYFIFLFFRTTEATCLNGSLCFATEVCVVDCGPRGSCIGGACHCEEGWTGPECEQRDCHPRCIDHGVCREGKCDCHQGWTGEHCTIGEPRWHMQRSTPTHFFFFSHEKPKPQRKFNYWQGKKGNVGVWMSVFSERFQSLDHVILLSLPTRF